MGNKALIIIPTYNEKENLPEMIPALFALGLGLEILVVDDNSPDGTGQLADAWHAQDPRVHVLHRQKKEGLGRAYIAGFQYALARDFEFIFEMDADFSHDPKYLAVFLEKIKDHDLVLGSRYLTGVNVINWPLARLLLSYFGNKYARWFLGLPFTDSTGGFKCFRRAVLEKIDWSRISSSGYSFQIEMNYTVWKKGFRIGEIPIVFTDRQRGTSKMSSKIIREALFLLWKIRLQGLWRSQY
jgi:dolichol-phosphate mannosyltransferase